MTRPIPAPALPPWLLSIAVVAAAATAAAALDAPRVHWVAKPLATLLCVAFAWRGGTAVSARYRGLVTAGMSLGLAGDVFLMLPGDRFIPGLAAFLLGHLCYLAAFTGEGGARWPWRPLVPLGVALGTFAWACAGRLGGLAVPVAAYAAVLSLTAWQANARPERPLGRLAGTGMWWFVLSDLVLAADRFADVLPAPADRIVVLSTYWLAQGAIAWSVHGAVPPAEAPAAA